MEIGALTLAAGVCGVSFYKINPIAGLIFIPYMAWLGFASLLNFSVYKLNSGAIEGSPDSGDTGKGE